MWFVRYYKHIACNTAKDSLMDHRNFKFTLDAATQCVIAGFLVSLTTVMVLFGFLPTLLQDKPFQEAAAHVGAHAALGVTCAAALLRLLQRFTWLWQYDVTIVLAVFGVTSTGTFWWGSYVEPLTYVAVLLAFFGLTVRTVALFTVAFGLCEPEDELPETSARGTHGGGDVERTEGHHDVTFRVSNAPDVVGVKPRGDLRPVQ